MGIKFGKKISSPAFTLLKIPIKSNLFYLSSDCDNTAGYEIHYTCIYFAPEP